MTYFSPSSRVHIDLAGLTASDVHVLKKFAPRVTMQNSIFVVGLGFGMASLGSYACCLDHVPIRFMPI